MNTQEYYGGENFNLHSILLNGKNLNLKKKVELFENFTSELVSNREILCRRCILTASDREIELADPFTGERKKMLMFGSNNYLGLGNDSYVKERAREIITEYGAGLGGPPLLNGYTAIHKELEKRLAELKGAEDAMVFSSGYGANVGLVSGLMNKDSIVIYDAYSHASFCDGIKLSGAKSFCFPHNNVEILERRLKNLRQANETDIFVAVEGVYSMDGDIAPLDKIVPLCKKYNAYLIMDDAHGTGVMGEGGKGTAEYFNLHGAVDFTMGTFSKAFSVTGGFVAGPQNVINYLRYFARSYMFSASLPPVLAAVVLAVLDIIQDKPQVLKKLKENIQYTAAKIKEMGLPADDKTPIFPLIAPEWMNIRKASYEFHRQGIFVNSIEYPAVPLSQQRFRISIMAVHTKEDIDRLLEAVRIIFNTGLGKEGEFSYAA